MFGGVCFVVVCMYSGVGHVWRSREEVHMPDELKNVKQKKRDNKKKELEKRMNLSSTPKSSLLRLFSLTPSARVLSILVLLLFVDRLVSNRRKKRWA